MLFNWKSLKNQILVSRNRISPCCFKSVWNPDDGPYCRRCAFLRKKFEEDLLTYCDENETSKDFEDISESSDDNTNVGNAPREPFVVNQDLGVQFSFRGEEIDEEYERDCEIRIQKLKQDFIKWGSKVRKKEQACEEEKYYVARRYMLSITCDDEDDSIPLGDIIARYSTIEHLDTIPATESDEVIKSSVENLVPIPSEFEGIFDNTCDVLTCENNRVNVVSDLVESLINRDTSIVPFFLISKLTLSLEDGFAGEIVSYCSNSHRNVKPILIQMMILRVMTVLLRTSCTLMHLLPISSTIASRSDAFFEESDTSFSHLDNSLPEFETFNDHTEETRSGSTTTHANYSLPESDSFLFEIEPDQEGLISIDNSNNTLLELPEFESFHFNPLFPRPPPESPDVCMRFKPILAMKNDFVKPNKDFYLSKMVLPLNVEDFDSFTFIIWTFLPYFTYPENSPLIFSFRSTDMSKIKRKPSKTGKHEHGNQKSTKEAKDSKLKPRKVNYGQAQTGKVNIPLASPQPVPTGKPKVHAPVPTSRQNRPFPVLTDRGYSPSVTSGWWKSTARPMPHLNRPTSSYFQTYTPYVPQMYYNHMKYGGLRWATAVKPSAGCSWKTHRKGLYWENPYSDAEDEGIFDSGCSRSMTGNMERLDDFQEFQGGKVTFGGGEGRITGKGTIRTPTLDFENVYYVKELQQFNLFSISQIYDKKNRALFTNTDCLVLSKDFMLPDESIVVLRVPRKHNLYTINLNNLSPRGNLACLVAKASVDESVKWHRRMGHVNYKNMNRLVKGNLVRGLPPKLFKNDHTCVACCKGKQHKASYKAITAVSSISESLQLLHMDLFGPTSIRSIDHKYYCLVITDDYSRFCWVYGTLESHLLCLKLIVTVIMLGQTRIGNPQLVDVSFWVRG
ncbi:putative ribonuclease H-like domain-containing protein [Tanacetum coccineum]